MFWFNFILGLILFSFVFGYQWSCMIMSETKDKFEPEHTFVVYYTYTRSRARAIFNYIPIVLKRQVYVQWILLTVTYACVTCNLTTQQTFKLRTLQRVRARIIPNISWRDHKTPQQIRAKKKTKYEISWK